MLGRGNKGENPETISKLFVHDEMHVAANPVALAASEYVRLVGGESRANDECDRVR